MTNKTLERMKKTIEEADKLQEDIDRQEKLLVDLEAVPTSNIEITVRGVDELDIAESVYPEVLALLIDNERRHLAGLKKQFKELK